MIETLATYAGALFLGVLAASLFAVKFDFVDPEPAGCSGHHFEKRRDTRNYRIKLTGGFGHSEYHVQREVLFACEHDGCTEERTEWKSIDTSNQLREAKAQLADYLSSGGSA